MHKVGGLKARVKWLEEQIGRQSVSLDQLADLVSLSEDRLFVAAESIERGDVVGFVDGKIAVADQLHVIPVGVALSSASSNDALSVCFSGIADCYSNLVVGKSYWLVDGVLASSKEPRFAITSVGIAVSSSALLVNIGQTVYFGG